MQLYEDIKVSTQLNRVQKKEFLVRGLKEHVVESLEDCLSLLRLGEVNRHYAETKMNHQSSRSHTLFRLHVESMVVGAQSNDCENVITESVLVRFPANSLELRRPGGQ